MGVLDGLETTLKNCRLYYQWHRKEEAGSNGALIARLGLRQLHFFLY